MTDMTRPGGDAGADGNPWAAPQPGPAGQAGGAQTPAPGQPGTPGPPPAAPPATPTVHDQVTVTSMPAAFPPAADSVPPPAPVPPPPPAAPQPPGVVPPPPVAPTGPGAPAGYGYPAQPPGYPAYPGPGYPGTPSYGWSAAPVIKQNGMGVAALVLGIISVCLFCAYGVVSLVLGVLAVVFGVKGRRKAERGEADNHTQAQAGLILGSIGIVLGLAMITFLIVVGVVAANAGSHDDPLYGDTLRAAPTARLVP
ncbi:hypothetical protein GCM10010512_25160 [Streptomyces thermoviolaceus subsp. thermoviolaceus]|uniref:DUF4190 domain-containing protein n=1 Tax=Streptomyces thermoviolaceus subsp. thermoviolaceus TaxID=66860 RepID=A0ABX0YQT8_STRTL|nr:DUF4190 domain-containing protein [Streptomyces thermoviolaceus]NJP14294.1 DUF4190 domain-containing protein [Streptomyces thermoviolaceus subsp. thermoviolaceus]GHA92504.1 hypothetical protein GCM10010512_25160 [Streptomyces thermoviolaceus subsp. thermoviolaceus]